MGKIIAIGIIVLGAWLGLEVYTKGTDAAFGGLFGSESVDSAVHQSPLGNIEDRAANARDAQLQRIEGQLDDRSVGVQGD